MGNSFYKAESILKAKNMIRYEYTRDTKYIGLNPYPDTWVTCGKDRIDEIMDNEINAILGIQKDALSSSSSSWSSSSSSSQSYPSNDDLFDEELLKKLDELSETKSKSKGRSHKKPKPIEPELLAELETL